MIECRDYELEISALLDGESDPSTAMELLEHVGTCRSCATFVGDVRAVQSKIDRVYVVAGPVFTEGSPPRRDRSIGPMAATRLNPAVICDRTESRVVPDTKERGLPRRPSTRKDESHREYLCREPSLHHHLSGP